MLHAYQFCRVPTKEYLKIFINIYYKPDNKICPLACLTSISLPAKHWYIPCVDFMTDRMEKTEDDSMSLNAFVKIPSFNHLTNLTGLPEITHFKATDSPMSTF